MDISKISDISKTRKAELLSGLNFWQTKPIDNLKIPSIFVTDGPHGIRKQKHKFNVAMLSNSCESTVFPTLSCAASSWDEGLIKRMGEAIGKEANEENVDVVLGPGLNIKRMPTCGRNFEYFSEDPYLSGKMAASYVRGLQSTGVSACLKHFVCSNMEEDRMRQDVIVDERALREIYLKGFEIAIKESQPNAIMTAYNKLNGVYCSENATLLTEILRNEWGYEGLVISDWGAVNNPVKATNAGLSLEMPFSKRSDAKRISAVEKGEIKESVLNDRVKDVFKLVSNASENTRKGDLYVASTHHELARKIASESIVLLRNDDEILPFDRDKKYLIIGEFAKRPVIQGAGSSLVNPTNVDTVYDEFSKRGIDFVYASYKSNKNFLETMVNVVDGIILFSWLDSSVESESFDRDDLNLPFAHQKELEWITKCNKNTVLVISSGSPVTFTSDVSTIIQTYLFGQAGAAALVDILFGEKNPCGKLAETYPIDSELPSHFYYDKDSKQVRYMESIFVGYRYYDKHREKILFPFGHGLSYTTFEYSNLNFSSQTFDGEEITVSFDIENTGNFEGKEIAQLYVRDVHSTVHKPRKELKGFKKIRLLPGQKKRVELKLNFDSLSYYDIDSRQWMIEPGIYEILVGSSSVDIRLLSSISYKSEADNFSNKRRKAARVYYDLSETIKDSDFETVYGEIPKVENNDEFTVDSSINDLKDTLFGKWLSKKLKSEIAKIANTDDESDPTYKMLYKMQMDMPLRVLSNFSGGTLSYQKLVAMLDFTNKKYINAINSYFKTLFNKNKNL